MIFFWGLGLGLGLGLFERGIGGRGLGFDNGFGARAFLGLDLETGARGLGLDLGTGARGLGFHCGARD